MRRSRPCAAGAARRAGRTAASGSSPSTRPSSSRTLPVGPSTTGPSSAERTSSQPTWGWRAQRGEQLAGGAVDLLARHPPRRAHEVDEAEVARAQDDDVAPGDGLLVGAWPAARRLVQGVVDHGLLLVAAGALRRRPRSATGGRARRGRSRCAAGRWRPASARGRTARRRRRAAGPDRRAAGSARSARRACAAPRACRRARGPEWWATSS